MSEKDLPKELSEKAKEHSARSPETAGSTLMLRFICPECGCRDLRTKFLEPYYPVSTLDGIEVDPDYFDLFQLYEREPSEYLGQGDSDGWQFWCDKCHLVPNLEEYDEEETQEASLARWLFDNCPQDEGLPAKENGGS
jgi:hypothetical protein